MKNRNLDHKDHWATPPHVYFHLNKQYNFDFDPCPLNHDLKSWDGTAVEWGKVNFVNPPYNLKSKEAFVKKAVEESKKGKLVVMLLPVSTSTKLFHETILKAGADVKFCKGRIPFIGINDKGQKVNWHLINESNNDTIDFEGQHIPAHIKNSGQHDSMVVVLGGK